MTWSDWVLINGLWLGMNAGGHLVRRKPKALELFWWLLILSGFAFWGHLWDPRLYQNTFLIAGGFLGWAAVRCSIYPRIPHWVAPVDTMATGLGLLLSGRWLALAAGWVAGFCLTIAIGPEWRKRYQHGMAVTQPVLLGGVALASLQAGWFGRYPDPHVSWLWLIPILLLTEGRLLYDDVSTRARRSKRPQSKLR